MSVDFSVSNPNNFLWSEKYRPIDIESCILPMSTKEMAKGYVEQGRLQTMLFKGGAGVGKTTLARAMCSEIGADWIIINGSSENGIDTLRTKITQFASTMSFSDARKVVIIDEADHLSNTFQAACRNFFEEFSSNCSFILTCNFPNRIIEPIHSRCAVIDFKIPSAERPNLASSFFKRISNILNSENVEFDKKVVVSLVQKHFPDFRKCINELQKYAASGKIDVGILANTSQESFNELFESLKAKKFNDMRKWCVNNIDTDANTIFRWFYDNASEKIQARSIPELILLINDYSFKSSQVVDQEINLVAFFLELMSSGIEWK
jgi:DNA polymerase III delta prime subunit